MGIVFECVGVDGAVPLTAVDAACSFDMPGMSNCGSKAMNEGTVDGFTAVRPIFALRKSHSSGPPFIETIIASLLSR